MKDYIVTLRISRNIQKVMTLPDNCDQQTIRAMADQLANTEFENLSHVDDIDVMSIRPKNE